MPNIRIMNWNIEQFSWSKSVIPGTARGLARVINDEAIDIVVILELKTVHTNDILITLMTELNQLAGGNLYTTAVRSPVTGGDCYGFIIRNTATVDPIFPYPAPNGPIRSMTNLPFFTRANRAAAGIAGMAVGAAAAPRVLALEFPLVDLYASRPPAARKEAPFPGQPMSGGSGGLKEGGGYRVPCLAMFRIASAANPVIPIIPCHFAANRSANTINPATRDQIRAIQYLHAPQIYLNVNGSHISLDGLPMRIEDLVVTGDFNMDFARNDLAAGAPNPTVHAVYSTLSDITAAGGSRVAAQAAQPPRGVAALAAAAPIPNPNMLTTEQIDLSVRYPLGLNIGVTNVGTILIPYDATAAAAVPANLAALRGPVFDNFFFGGTNLEPVVQFLAAPAHMPAVANADCAYVVDVPSKIMRNGAGVAGGIDVLQTAAYHALPDVSKNANHAPQLRVTHAAAVAAAAAAGAAAPAPLSTNDRLIGARMLSDHLPVVVQFNIP